MISYILAMAVIFGLSITSKIVWLASTEREPRNPGVVALEAVIEVLLLLWTVIMFMRGVL